MSFWIRCFRVALTFVFIFFVRAMSVDEERVEEWTLADWKDLDRRNWEERRNLPLMRIDIMASLRELLWGVWAKRLRHHTFMRNVRRFRLRIRYFMWFPDLRTIPEKNAFGAAPSHETIPPITPKVKDVAVQTIVEQWNAVTQTSGPVQTLVMHWNMFMQSSWAWFVGGRLGLRRELGV